MRKHDIIDTVESGKRIKELCKEKNIKASEIAYKMDLCDESVVYRWSKGSSFPSIYALYELSRILGTSVDDLIVAKKVKAFDMDEER